ncbi:hypothetical protein [Chryseobacterium sp. MEBOG07]|uniref:hypothetical protein n=1 Tax=Chryseobacterium sp. MEBOG07 TaxID=2879939 RepID=UPI001F1DE39F|nr:hypothetical protein [Chryseobacterium sp. MEBOG07]UKB78312.1 hypothetical protein LF886_17775 [Chryseobacterium sp. MEBOG07]
MFLKIDDKFDDKSKRIKKKNYQLGVWFESYEKISFQTVKDNQSSVSSKESVGTKYYQIEVIFKKRTPITIIIPSVVIAQAFYFVNSLIIQNLFRADFEELTEMVKWEPKTKGGSVIEKTRK